MIRMTIALVGVVTALAAAAPLQTPAGTPPPIVVFETAKGTFEITFFADDAPKSVTHILERVRQSFYRGQRVFRVENSLIQFGDIQTRDATLENLWGRGGGDKPINAFEVSKKHPHLRGAVGLAHSGNPMAADSQLYIMKAPSPGLDGKHAVIGKVTKGMDAVDRIEKKELFKNVYVKAAAPK